MLIRSAAASIAIALLAVIVVPSSADAHDLPPFEDSQDTYYTDAVRALSQEHLIAGCEVGVFCPADAMTRGQVSSILASVLDATADEIEVTAEPDHLITGDVEPEPLFADAVGTTHEEAITAIAEAGVALGCGDGDFCPNEPVTRAQMATLLVEVFDPPATDEAMFDDTSSQHADAIDRLAAAGIAAGCDDSLTAFCPDEEVLRSHVALFVARALDYVERVELASLEERRAEQEEIDAQRAAEEEARRQAEEEARRQAEQEAAEREAAEREAAANQAADQNWRNLAECESGMYQRAYNPAGPYYGYFQFNIGTWQSVGMTGDPRDYSWDQQLAAAKRLHADRGWAPWPACASKLGLL